VFLQGFCDLHREIARFSDGKNTVIGGHNAVLMRMPSGGEKFALF
jgi:hypothetical protein